MVYGIDSFVHFLSQYFSGPRKKPAMDSDEFRKFGKQTVDYIADYLDNIGKRRVVPSIEPGYLKSCIPDSAPVKPESYQQVLDDMEQFIMSGVSQLPPLSYLALYCNIDGAKICGKICAFCYRQNFTFVWKISVLEMAHIFAPHCIIC